MAQGDGSRKGTSAEEEQGSEHDRDAFARDRSGKNLPTGGDVPKESEFSRKQAADANRPPASPNPGGGGGEENATNDRDRYSSGEQQPNLHRDQKGSPRRL
jgi:hypothetical protein